MTVTVELWCDECGWEDEVEKQDEKAADIAASAKAAAHVSTNDCPYGSTDYEITEDE